jgi:hypothetical protein
MMLLNDKHILQILSFFFTEYDFKLTGFIIKDNN